MMKRMAMTLMALILGATLLTGAEKTLSIRQLEMADQLFEELSLEIAESFKKIPERKMQGQSGRPIEGIGILPFEGDNEGNLYNQVRNQLLKTRYNFYEREHVNALLSEQKIQMADFYSKEGRLKIGRLTQWKGIVFGKVRIYTEPNLGKQKVYVSADISLDNMETGQIVWHESIRRGATVQYPMVWFFIGIFMILIFTIIGNKATKMMHTSIVLAIAFLTAMLYTVWFFII
jgi:hypothetical protein